MSKKSRKQKKRSFSDEPSPVESSPVERDDRDHGEPSPNEKSPSRDPSSKEPEPAKKGWGKRLVLLAVALLLIVWALPILVAHTPLAGWAVNRATGKLNGEIQFEQVSLGWFSPVQVEKVRVLDEKGQPVVEMDAIKGDRSLFALATDLSCLGTFRLIKPVIRVELREDGQTNLETVLEEYLVTTDESTEPFSVQIELVDGKLNLEDLATGQKTLIDQFNLDAKLPDASDLSTRLTTSGTILDKKTPGRFEVEAEVAQSGQVTMTVEQIALENFAALLKRFLPEWKLAGRLNTELKCHWDDRGPLDSLVAEATLQTESLIVQNRLLGPEPVPLGIVQAQLKAHRETGKTVVDQADVTSVIAQINLDGKLELDDGKHEEQIKTFLNQEFKVVGHVDLAQVARLMPKMLRLQDQTTVSKGDLNLLLESRRQPSGQMAYRGQLRTSDLTASRRGRELIWQKPIVVSVEASRKDGQVVLDHLGCDSEFLNIRAQGRHGHLKASVEFDLAKLDHQLDAFVTLDGISMSGNGWLRLVWDQDDQGKFHLRNDATVRDWRLSLVPNRPWTERSLTLGMKADGRWSPEKRVLRLDAAEAELIAGTEELRLKLKNPVEGQPDRIVWPIGLEAQGQMASWSQRAHAWNLLETWAADGAYQIRADTLLAADQVEIRGGQVIVQQFQLRGPDLSLYEPSVEGNLDGRYRIAERRLLVDRALAKTGGLYLLLSGLLVGVPENGPMELAGAVEYQGAIPSVLAWFPQYRETLARKLGGWFSGKAQLKQIGATTQGQLETTIHNGTYQTDSGKQVHEPEIRLNAGGTFDQAKKLLTLDKFQLHSSGVSAEGKGDLHEADSQTVGRFDGKIDYDTAALVKLARPFIGGGVAFRGNGSRPLELAGPLDPKLLSASGGADWAEAYVYGFRLGPGKVDATLKDGLLQFAPIDPKVGEGKLYLVPRVDLRPEKAILEVEPGKLIDRVRIDPAMCAHFLQYIAPILAGVAEADGTFSLELDQCRIPVENPAAGQFKGKLLIHAVRVGVGPMLRELVVVLSEVKAAELKKESVVPFQMANGRIYHENLELVFPDMTIRTHGWVGLDKSVSLVAQMPVPPKWLAQVGGSLKTSLQQQTLQIPITGTLDRPQLDRRRLDQYSQQFLQRAAGNVLQEEVDRQLNRLFQPKK